MAALIAGTSARANLCAEALGRPQPILDEKDPFFRVLDTIWRRVYAPFLRATGRVTELVVLGPDARTSTGASFPAIAMACQRPRNTPAVVVTAPFLKIAAAGGGLDEPFVALIVAHELGHRLHDFDVAGAFKAGADEGRADQRGAFLAAAAGYDARGVVCEDRIDAYLDAEGVKTQDRAARRAALPEVLRRFEMWETVYRVASGLAFSNPLVATALLTASREELARLGESLPEMQLLEALALMHEAASRGCWTEAAYTPGFPNDHLRCIPVFASNTSLAPGAAGVAFDKSIDPTRGCDMGATRKLERAAAILDTIDTDVVSALSIATARACVAFYLGELDEAAGHATAAEALLTPSSPAEVRLALSANSALIAWLRWWSEDGNRPPEVGASSSAVLSWRKDLRVVRRGFAGHGELDAWLDIVSGKHGRRRQTGRTARPPRCAGGQGAPEGTWGDAVLPALPDLPAAGGCPCDWVEWASFMDPLAPSIAEGVVRLCSPAGDGGTGITRLVEVHLPMRGARARVMLYRPLAGPLAEITTWQSACDELEMVGVMDSGLLLWQGSCVALGGPQVLLEGDGCAVRAVIR